MPVFRVGNVIGPDFFMKKAKNIIILGNLATFVKFTIKIIVF